MKDRNQIVVETLIDKMFEIAGHNVGYQDIKERTDNWYQQWTMTQEQNDEWRAWGIKFLKKKRFLRPEREMAMFDLNYGLKIENGDNS